MDFAKAFDNLNYHDNIQPLKMDFLTFRTHTVSIDGVQPNTINATSGVSKGKVWDLSSCP